jgi:hypothetical protein
MSSMSTDARRRRGRGLAGYGVTIITIALILLVVEIVAHQAGNLYSSVSHGLSV